MAMNPEEQEATTTRHWMEWLFGYPERWSKKSLGPASYWGDRYEDVLYERVDGFLSGVIVGLFIGAALTLLIVAVLA